MSTALAVPPLTVAAVPAPAAVAFDLEGGLIDVSGIHHLAGDSSLFYPAMLGCPPNHSVLSAARDAFESGAQVLVMTGAGRDLQRLITTWLGRNGVPPTTLLMLRGRGDYRPSAVVKREKLRHLHRQFPQLTVWSADPSVIRLSERDGMGVEALEGYWGEVA